MFDAAFTISMLFGVVGCVSGLGSVAYQRRQTQLMERALEAPEGATGTGMESKFTALLNKRLNDTRARLRDEYRPRLTEIEGMLRDSRIADYIAILKSVSKRLDDEALINATAEETSRMRNEVLTARDEIQAESGRNSNDIDALEREIAQLQQRVEDMRKGIGFHDTVVKQVRSIAEQLLQITSQPEAAGHDAMIEPDEGANQNETAGHDTMVRQNENLGQDVAANQGETVGRDWMMERDETVGRDGIYGYGG